MITTVVPFGISCAIVTNSIPTAPTFDATKTQSPVWTEPDGAGPDGGKMDWFTDTNDTNDVPPEEGQEKHAKNWYLY